MKHLIDEQIRRMALDVPDSKEDERLAEHLDACRECRARYVAALLPSVRDEEPLSAVRKEELFEAIDERFEASRRTVAFPRVVYRAAGGLALAAGLILAFLFTDNPSDNAPVAPVAVASRGSIDSAQTGVVVAEVTGGVTVNGVAYNAPRTVPEAPVTVKTGRAEGARLELASTASFEVHERTSLSLQSAEADTVTATLSSGSIEARWDRSSGRELSVSVPGGVYRVVGTIFRISVDPAGSSIEVIKGAVAFLADRAAAVADTVEAGRSRSYSLDGSPRRDRGVPAGVPRTALDSGMAAAETGRHGEAEPEAPERPAVSADEFFGEYEEPQEPGQVEYTALQRAKAARQLGRPREAVEILRGLLAGPRPPAKAYIGLGQAFEMMGEADSAMRCYEAATDLRTPSSTRAAAWLHVGRLAQETGAFEKSAVAYQSYLETAPEGSHRNEAFEKLYRHFIREGNLDRQMAVLKQWAEDAPELDQPLYLLATAYHRKGDYRYALRYFETYIMKYPHGAEREAAMYYAADCSRRMGERGAYAKKAHRYKDEYPRGRFIDLVERD